MGTTTTSSTCLIPILILISIAGVRSADTITPSTPLSDGEKLLTSDEVFALGFFTPPGSTYRYLGLWYNQVAEQTILWVANRNNPVTGGAANLSLSSVGVLIISDARSGDVVWTSGSPAKQIKNPVAQLISGNLVVHDKGNTDPASYAWEGFDYPTDTLIPGMKLGMDRGTGHNWNLTGWSSPSDPASGQYVGVMVAGGDPELFLYRNNRRIWRTGPWNGVQFSGVPDTRTYSNFINFTFINNGSELSYSYQIIQPSIYARLVVNYTGVAQRSVWAAASGTWSIFWYAPRDQCDALATCGQFGICDPNNSPVCDCMQGFTPRSPQNWALRDSTGGCRRKTPLDCKNGTDGFAFISNAKLPDTGTALVDRDLGLTACRTACLRNCSCTGYAVANVSSNGGCVMWTAEMTDVRIFADGGQDLYVRLAAADLGPTQSGSKKRSNIAIIISVSVLAAAALLAAVGVFLWRRKKIRRALPTVVSFHDPEIDRTGRDDDLELPLFDFGTIVAATDDFALANKLGEGGFGPVYKGTLGDDTEIGVKRLAKTSVQGIDEFKNEVMLIAKLQHRNLVRLLGCCIRGDERMLVYEYMPNKSLDMFLFDKSKSALLNWPTRYKIIMGIARGLLYLHQDSRFRIIHRDLKTSNILLDKEMTPKISDFGMARIFGGDETEANTMRVVGTYGYMSPEYAMDGVFSVKSDVYSFGVLVLEIITGKKNRGVYQSSPHLNLLGHAWSLWNEGNSLDIADQSMGSFPVNEVLRCIKVGLLCVQELPEDRPLMSSVVLMLGSDSASVRSPKQPGFVTKRGASETESTSSKQTSTPFDALTITVLEGR